MQMKILIVDDDAIKVEMIKKSIAYTNADITVIRNGKEALLDILVEDYDYLISDMQFPWSSYSNSHRAQNLFSTQGFPFAS